MTLTELATLVKETRDNQKLYFKERTQSTLVKSKESEKKVDQAAEEILNRKNIQKSIFE